MHVKNSSSKLDSTDEPFSFFVQLSRNDTDTAETVKANGSNPMPCGYSDWAAIKPKNRKEDSEETQLCEVIGLNYTMDPLHRWRDVPCQDWPSRFICQRMKKGECNSSDKIRLNLSH